MKYFSIKELTNSATAKAQGIDNTPTPEAEQNLTELVETLLDPLREAWGAPIRVSSGYRGWKLNKAVKGSKTSAHCFGYAADLVPKDGHIDEFKAFVKKWLETNNIAFDQYIDEKSGNSTWVHIGLKNVMGEQRKQFLKYRNGQYSFI